MRLASAGGSDCSGGPRLRVASMPRIRHIACSTGVPAKLNVSGSNAQAPMLLMKNGALKWLRLAFRAQGGMHGAEQHRAGESSREQTVITDLGEARTRKIPNSRFAYYRYQRTPCQAVPRADRRAEDSAGNE